MIPVLMLCLGCYLLVQGLGPYYVMFRAKVRDPEGASFDRWEMLEASCYVALAGLLLDFSIGELF